MVKNVTRMHKVMSPKMYVQDIEFNVTKMV